VYGTVHTTWRAFKGCPDDDLEASLWVARAALDETLDALDSVWHRLDMIGRGAS
jgi:hypothetical protein